MNNSRPNHANMAAAIMKLSMVAPLVFDLLMRVLGPVLVIFVWSLLAAYAYTYFQHVVPAYQWNLFEWPANVITPLGLTILYNLYHNHIFAVFTQAGAVPSEVPQMTDMERLLNEESVARGAGFSKVCRRCKKLKPPRTHHCHVCGTCVLRMDHHCPWLANCVGFRNYRFFFLFLMWLTLACIFFVSVSLPLIVYHQNDPYFRRHEPYIMIGFIVAISAVFAVGGLWFFHVYLVLTNQTTIELYYNRHQASLAKKRSESWVNPFDLGWRLNFALVIGGTPLNVSSLDKLPSSSCSSSSSSLSSSSSSFVSRCRSRAFSFFLLSLRALMYIRWACPRNGPEYYIYSNHHVKQNIALTSISLSSSTTTTASSSSSSSSSSPSFINVESLHNCSPSHPAFYDFVSRGLAYPQIQHMKKINAQHQDEVENSASSSASSSSDGSSSNDECSKSDTEKVNENEALLTAIKIDRVDDSSSTSDSEIHEA